MQDAPQVSRAIVRGLWGEGNGYSDHELASTVRAAAQRGDAVDRVYCFGADNARLLRSCGYEPVMLDKRPWGSPRPSRKKLTRRLRTWRWGVSYWWHKARILQAATREFDHVLWLDFDAAQMRPVPDWLWARMVEGPPFRAPLTVQRSSHFAACWREHGGQPGVAALPGTARGDLAAKLVPGGGLIYMRGSGTADSLMALHRELPLWSGQRVAALWLDRCYGEWVGARRYVALGHEPPPVYRHSCSLFPPPEGSVVWQCGERGRAKYLGDPVPFMEA